MSLAVSSSRGPLSTCSPSRWASACSSAGVPALGCQALMGPPLYCCLAQVDVRRGQPGGVGALPGPQTLWGHLQGACAARCCTGLPLAFHLHPLLLQLLVLCFADAAESSMQKGCRAADASRAGERVARRVAHGSRCAVATVHWRAACLAASDDADCWVLLLALASCCSGCSTWTMTPSSSLML